MKPDPLIESAAGIGLAIFGVALLGIVVGLVASGLKWLVGWL